MRSKWQIARLQHITPQHLRRVYRKYKGAEHPKLLSCGRPPEPLNTVDLELVMSVRKEHPVGAVNLEKILDRRGTRLPHNRIHRILKSNGFARTEPKKSRRRKWIRYERRYSNNLWHTDWFEVKRKHWIVFLDDASRLAACVREFDRAASENSVTALNEAVSKWGTPKQVMSDHGVQFTLVQRDGCAKPQPNAFQTRLNELEIRHIKARVKHPQSNGKAERFVRTIRELLPHFGTLEKTVEYYNFRRPHMSLENDSIRTPHQAFKDRTRKNG